MKHGLSGYTKGGCRCDMCRGANKAYHAGWVAQKRAEMLAGLVQPEHGTQATYSVYRCRCEACRSAHSVYTRKIRQYKQRTRGAS